MDSVEGNSQVQTANIMFDVCEAERGKGLKSWWRRITICRPYLSPAAIDFLQDCLVCTVTAQCRREATARCGFRVKIIWC
jgi:hypothetical protein